MKPLTGESNIRYWMDDLKMNNERAITDVCIKAHNDIDIDMILINVRRCIEWEEYEGN